MAVCIFTPSVIWKIENFASIYTKLSPAILIGGLKWHVRFTRFWNGDSEKIFLILKCETASDTTSWMFTSEVYIVKPHNGDRVHGQTAKYTYKYNEEYCIWESNIDRIYSTAEGQIKDAIFSIVILPIGDIENLFKSQKCIEEVCAESLCLKSLIEDFRKLYNNEANSDFTLKCGTKMFHVHKAVLSTRSDFFASMFRCNMKEANKGTGTIENMEPETLELVLRYMYTGELPKLSLKLLRKVYAAADRFCMEILKIKCYSLFIDNFVTYLEEDFGKKTGKETTKVSKQCEDVEEEQDGIEERNFLKDLFASKEWKLFSQEFPHKAQEMCRPYLLQM